LWGAVKKIISSSNRRGGKCLDFFCRATDSAWERIPEEGLISCSGWVVRIQIGRQRCPTRRLLLSFQLLKVYDWVWMEVFEYGVFEN